MNISIPNTSEPTHSEQSTSIGAVTGPGMNATGKGTQSPSEIMMKEAVLTCRLRRSLLLLGLEAVLWLVVLRLASIALLCWSASILLNSFVNGPSLAMAANGTPIAVTNPAIAVIMMAVSFMLFDVIQKGICDDSAAQLAIDRIDFRRSGAVILSPT